jgi:hypothetical protein
VEIQKGKGKLAAAHVHISLRYIHTHAHTHTYGRRGCRMDIRYCTSALAAACRGTSGCIYIHTHIHIHMADVGVEWTYGTAQAHWQPRAGAHLVAIGDMLVLIGGWTQDGNAQRTHMSDVWVTQQRCHKASLHVCVCVLVGRCIQNRDTEPTHMSRV